MTRVYVLTRGGPLPPLVFRSLAAAKRCGERVYPFSTKWFKEPQVSRQFVSKWVGDKGGTIHTAYIDKGP